jgi:predicted nucleic acid-binding protein
VINYPTESVVDASVGIKLFVDEPLSEQAHLLFGGLIGDPPYILYVPDLFYIECANILWKYVRRYGCSLEDSQKDLADLKNLELRVASTIDLMEDALTLAAQTDLTTHDACYAVLADRLELPLVTADEFLVKACPGAVWLGDLTEKQDD